MSIVDLETALSQELKMKILFCYKVLNSSNSGCDSELYISEPTNAIDSDIIVRDVSMGIEMSGDEFLVCDTLIMHTSLISLVLTSSFLSEATSHN